MFSLPRIDMLIERWRAMVSGQADPTPEVEEAERTIEQRMASVRDRVAKGGYKRLPQDELEQLADDIAKILDFVEEALTTLGLAGANANCYSLTCCFNTNYSAFCSMRNDLRNEITFRIDKSQREHKGNATGAQRAYRPCAARVWRGEAVCFRHVHRDKAHAAFH